MRALRREARDRFAELGFPTTKLEDWRYTNVAPIARTDWVEAVGGDVTRADIEHLSFPVFACSLFVFVNGHFAADLSTHGAAAGGVEVRSLADAPDPRLGTLADIKRSAFTAWNTAQFADGAEMRIPSGVDLSQPIHLVFLSEPGAAPSVAHPRVLILAEEGSRASVIEDYVSFGDGTFFTNAVTEIEVGANAELEYVRFQREDPSGYHVSAVYTRQERDSRLAAHSIVFGGALVRNDVSALLVGEGADCTLNGLFLGTDRRHVDNHTLIDHAVPHTTSRELYKGVLAGRSRGIFHGRIVVRPDAQKTDARQASKNLLLSEGAELDTKPQLEIHADDVKCSHGSTIGQLDEGALFYLRSRGIDEANARRLLTRAFASEVTDALRFDPLRERVQDQLVELLEAA
ncbi:MAG: Fe-S cluster assembly protein SufD [Planctomycetota bacterium]|jgi:Fe-S cluster assembly protein SufD